MVLLSCDNTLNSFYKTFFSPPQVLVYLQLCKNISTVIAADWQKVTDHVCAVTKALAKRPFRYGVRSRRNEAHIGCCLSQLSPFPSRLLTERAELPFCTEGSWASGVRVGRDGSGLTRVWSSQLQQLNRVSPAVASAVTAAFPSPQLLLQVPPGGKNTTSRPVDAVASGLVSLRLKMNPRVIAGVPGLGGGGGQEGAAGRALSENRRYREARGARDISPNLPLLHGPEPTAGSGLIWMVFSEDGSCV